MDTSKTPGNDPPFGPVRQIEAGVPLISPRPLRAGMLRPGWHRPPPRPGTSCADLRELDAALARLGREG